MLLRFFLLFTIVPSLELWLLFQVKEMLGLFETIYLVLLTGIIGASMAKKQGVLVIQNIQSDVQNGQMPQHTLVEALLVLIGGVLLITPGVMTDFFGFSLIIPTTRRLWVPLVQRWFKNRVNVQGTVFGNSFTNQASPSTDVYRDVTPDGHQVTLETNPNP